MNSQDAAHAREILRVARRNPDNASVLIHEKRELFKHIGYITLAEEWKRFCRYLNRFRDLSEPADLRQVKAVLRAVLNNPHLAVGVVEHNKKVFIALGFEVLVSECVRFCEEIKGLVPQILPTDDMLSIPPRSFAPPINHLFGTIKVVPRSDPSETSTD